MWASSLLETVVSPELSPTWKAIPPSDARLALGGDLELARFAAGELRRSYAVLPVRLARDLVRLPQVGEFLAKHSRSGDSERKASPADGPNSRLRQYAPDLPDVTASPATQHDGTHKATVLSSQSS